MRKDSRNRTTGNNYGDSGGSQDGGYYGGNGGNQDGGYYGGNQDGGYYGGNQDGGYYGGNRGTGYYGNSRQSYDDSYDENYSGSDPNYDENYGGTGQGYDGGYGGTGQGYDGGYGGVGQGYDGTGQYYGDNYGGQASGYGSYDAGSGYYNDAPGNGSDGYYNGAPGNGSDGYYNGVPGNGSDGYYNGAPGNGNDDYYNGVPGGEFYGVPSGRGTGEPPRKKKKKSRVGDVISIVVMVVALGVFAFAGYQLYGYYKEYKKVDEEYANLATYTTDETESEDLDALEADAENNDMQSLIGREVKTVEIDGEEVTLPVMTNPIDFASLKEVNSDIVGWLKIRALDLSYPVVQGEDNDYYLHRSFEQEDLFAGCLFVNFENNSDFTDQNTIIYGHNMKNGSMFGTLKNLRNEETYNTSKYFWIFTEDIIYLYRIISARVVDKVGQTYQIVFTEEEFEEFLNTAMENSEVDNSDVSVSTDDKIVTLSTCTGDSSTRFVVQGKLVQMYASK